MKVNLNVPFHDVHGKPITQMVEGKESEVNIADYLAGKLFAAQPTQGKAMESEELLFNARLSRKIMDNPKDVELNAKEILHIEEMMSRCLVAGTYWQLYEILEGNNINPLKK